MHGRHSIPDKKEKFLSSTSNRLRDGTNHSQKFVLFYCYLFLLVGQCSWDRWYLHRKSLGTLFKIFCGNVSLTSNWLIHQANHRCLSWRLCYLQCVKVGDTTFLHKANDEIWFHDFIHFRPSPSFKKATNCMCITWWSMPVMMWAVPLSDFEQREGSTVSSLRKRSTSIIVHTSLWRGPWVERYVSGTKLYDVIFTQERFPQYRGLQWAKSHRQYRPTKRPAIPSFDALWAVSLNPNRIDID